MNKILILPILLLNVCILIAQDVKNDELGYFFDINGLPIDNYLDIDYNPDQILQISYPIEGNAVPGYYYDSNNTKVTGTLRYSSNNVSFKFKKDNSEKIKTIKPNDCRGFVVGIDSFAVINLKTSENSIRKKYSKKKFAEVINMVDNISFYKSAKTTYLFKVDTSNSYYPFPKEKNAFAKKALSVFGHFDLLRKNIQSNMYKISDIPKMVKLLEYKYKLDNDEKIYFTKSWDETNNSSISEYSAKILSLKDSIWDIMYSNKRGDPIYKGQFSSFYPNNKNGEFIWYYPDGNIRKKSSFVDNEPKGSITTYHKNGNIHYEYEYVDDILTYSKVVDINGINILNESGNGKEILFDSSMNREIIRKFNLFELSSSYYTNHDGEKVYQQVQKDAKLKAFDLLKSKIYEEFNYPVESIKDYNHGFSLVKCIIKSNGFVDNVEIVKGVDLICNKELVYFFSERNDYKQWNPGKNEMGKITQELLIPVFFSLESFSKYRNYGNYNLDMLMMQHQMMMQHQFINTF